MSVAVPEPTNESTELVLFSGSTEGTVLAALLERLARAKDALKQWQAEETEVAAALKEFIGDSTHVKLDGSEVVTYDWKDSFRGKDFAKDYPDLYRRFTRPIEKDTFDVDWFRSAHPELYREYQSRALVSKYVVRPPAAP